MFFSMEGGKSLLFATQLAIPLRLQLSISSRMVLIRSSRSHLGLPSSSSSRRQNSTIEFFSLLLPTQVRLARSATSFRMPSCMSTTATSSQLMPSASRFLRLSQMPERVSWMAFLFSLYMQTQASILILRGFRDFSPFQSLRFICLSWQMSPSFMSSSRRSLLSGHCWSKILAMLVASTGRVQAHMGMLLWSIFCWQTRGEKKTLSAGQVSRLGSSWKKDCNSTASIDRFYHASTNNPLEPTQSSRFRQYSLRASLVWWAEWRIDKLMSEDRVRIRLPNAREKLQSLFPEDNRGDVRIIFGKRSFKLQKAFLRLESGFFKRTFTQPTETLEIKQDFPEGSFANVLKCFYGFTVEVPRCEILDYFQIIKYLEVESLLRVLREDMAARADRYDVFALLQLAHRFNEQELFENCLAQLERESFQQMRAGKASLLRCPTELFKMLVKTHNRLKAERPTALTYLQVDALIRDFSEAKKLGEAAYQELKFELIDKKSLNAQQYKEIFLDDAKKKGEEYRSMMKLSPDPTALYNSAFTSNIFSASKLTESVIEPIKKLNDELTFELEHTYEKKRNEELQAQNAQLAAQLAAVKNKLNDCVAGLESLKDIVGKLQDKLEEKERVDKDQTTAIKKLEKLEKTCTQLRTEISGRNDVIKKLEERVGKLEKQPEKRLSGNPKYIQYDDEEDESKTIQSQIVPGHLLKEIAKPAAQALSAPPGGAFKKAKQAPVPVSPMVQAKIEEQPDEEDLQEMYSCRLEFDEEPLGCRKSCLPKIADIITTEGFQKKKLRLLYRRNNNGQSVGQPSDIRCRDSLLFIFCTKLNYVFGGFISVQIPKNSKEYLADDGAFLFSLTKSDKEKIMIKKSRIHEAVYVSSQYLIGFSNDVMISLDPIKTPSDCSFPDAYDTSKESRTPRWLTGEDNSFGIRSIEVYEVREEEMIMDL